MNELLYSFARQGLIGAEGDSLEPEHLERLYVFALMWSLGALLELGDRDRMEEHIRKHIGKEGFGSLDLPVIPEGSSYTMFEYRVNEEGKECCGTEEREGEREVREGKNSLARGTDRSGKSFSLSLCFIFST